MQSRQELDAVLGSMLESQTGVSDLNFTPSRPPQAEVGGRLVPVGPIQKPLSTAATEAIARTLISDTPGLWETLESTGSCDMAYALPDGCRLRVNVFRVRGNYSIVLRVLPSRAPTFEEMGLPETLSVIPTLLNGLVLVTGATGAGKTTTMTAILDAVNKTRPVHVVTLEDPIEFVHEHQVATFNQRELGTDFQDYADGLRAALRQAPRVVFVGEIRDRETMETCLKAAETGHLVLSTLHTVDAGQTINRVVGMFRQDEQQFVHVRLADALKWTVSQRLLPREGEGRVAALEIMGSSLRVRELILHGEDDDRTFRKTIEDARPHGWQTFDQHIAELLEQGAVSEPTAMAACSDSSYMHRVLDRVRAARGEETSELGELQMAYARKARG